MYSFIILGLLITIIGTTTYYVIKINKVSEKYSESNPFISYFHSLDKEIQIAFLNSLNEEYQSLFQTMLNIEVEEKEKQLLIDIFNYWANRSGIKPYQENNLYEKYL